MLNKLIPKRFIVHSFDKVANLKNFLGEKQPYVNVMYFRASWNPMCKKTDIFIEEFANNNPGVLCTKFDCEKDEFAAKYYAIKYEPEFLVCLYGQEMARVIGDDAESVNEKVKKVFDFGTKIDLVDGTKHYEDYAVQKNVETHLKEDKEAEITR